MSNHRTTRMASRVAGSLVVALLGGIPSLASAAVVRRINPSQCQVVSGTMSMDLSTGQVTNNGPSGLVLMCPMHTDNGALITAATVTGWSTGCVSGVPGFKARVCSSLDSGGGANCTPTYTQPSGCGSARFPLGLTVPTIFANEYPYIELIIHAPSPGNNTVFGYSYTSQ
jgi:hypothetical protein